MFYGFVALASVGIISSYRQQLAAHKYLLYGLGGLFLLVGGLAALDFDRAFVVFHSLFFPGKTNWLFDPRTDEIINILPEVFFRNCAILILAVLVLGCAGLIVGDLWAGRKARTAEKA